jgi:hypothetical protein
MSEKIQKFILSMVGVLVMSILVGYFIYGWTEPSQSPPQGNVPAPLNVSLNPQAKEGSLLIATNPSILTAPNPTGLIVQYGNVGIGTTTPTDKLTISGGNLNLSGNRITNVATPIDNSDAATKGYVDAQGGGGVVIQPSCGWIRDNNPFPASYNCTNELCPLGSCTPPDCPTGFTDFGISCQLQALLKSPSSAYGVIMGGNCFRICVK